MSRSSAAPAASGRDEAPPDLRLVPVVACLWAGCWCATTGGAWAVGAAAGFGLASLIALGLLVRRRRWGTPWLAASAVAGLLACAAGALAWWTTQAGPVAAWARDGAVMRVEARVRGDPVTWPAHGVLPERTVVPVEVLAVEARETTVRLRQRAELVLADDAPGLAVGQRIALAARAGVADPGSGLALQLRQLGELTVTAEPGALDRVLTGLRAGLHAAMVHSPPEQAGLVPSLVVGDTSALPQGVVAQFRATNLSHLVAVSGTNLTLMLGFVLLVAKRAGARGWILRVVAGVCVAWFVLLCRAEPSVLRAAAMGLVGLLASGTTRDPRRGLRQLALAVGGLLLVCPWMAHSWGFALSAAATAGILWWSGRWQAAMSAWAPLWLAEALCVPLAAQLATQPLVTALSGQVSLVGLYANLAAAPFVGPVTVLGLLAILVAPVSSLAASGVGWLAGWCAAPILLVARGGAALPGATVPVGTSAVALMLVGAVCLLVAAAVGPLLRRAWTVALAVGALVVAVAVPTPTPGWPGVWSVVFCDVGQGDAAVVSVGPHAGVLIDAGPDPPALRRCLDALGITALPLVVFSHEHADHTAGALDLGRRYALGQVMVRAGLSAGGVDQVRALLGDAAVPIGPARTGEQLVVGPLAWTTVVSGPVFALAEPGEGENADENNAGTIGLARVDGLSVLFTGDAEPSEQAAALGRVPDLRVDVLKVPHHGSSRQDADFVAATGARVAVISVGADNDYGHPAARTVTLLGADGMRVWRTDERGSLAVAQSGSGLAVRAQR